MTSKSPMESTIAARLEHWSRTEPTRPALVRPRFGGPAEICTFGDLARRANAFAALFAERTDDAAIIPIYMSKSSACVAAMLGALSAGRAFAVLNPRLRTAQVAAAVARCGSPLALIDPTALAAIRRGGDASTLAKTAWHLVVDGPLDRFQQSVVAELGTTLSITEYPADHQLASWSAPAVTANARGCCLFTSGSTGDPKGVVIAESDLAARARAEIEWFGLGPEDRLLSILPFSFDVGLNQLLAAITVGCRLVLLDSWLPADIIKAAADHRITGISAVPTIWQDMLRAGLRFETRDRHAALRYITLSGGDLAPNLLEHLPTLAPGVGVFKTYGQTEFFRATCLLPEQFARRPTSVGKPFTGVHVYIISDEGTRCRPGERGEIVLSGLGTMMGYLGAESDDKLRPNPHPDPGDRNTRAVFTGDYGHLDEEGFLFIEGRRDAMLKVMGNRVYPHEIAAQLLRLPEVADAQVVGVRADDGVHLYAFVTAPVERACDPNAIRRQLSEQLPSYMVPRRTIVMSALPRTISGKPDGVALMVEAEAIHRSDTRKETAWR